MASEKINDDKTADVSTWVDTVPAADEQDLDLMEKEKTGDYATELLNSHRIQLTKEELEDLESHLDEMPVDKAKQVLSEVYAVHRHDPRYSPELLTRMKMFIEDPTVAANPQLYGQLLYEMRIFALLTSISSAYPEVRAVASDTDNPATPSLTIRVWFIGTLLSAIGCVINAVFALRFPTISIGGNVIQLVAYPMGLAMAKWLPKRKVLGINLNPGPFSRKEHMLIVVMSNLGMAWPPTQHLIFVQAMPQYFGMQYARNPGYQFLSALATNMIGFGFAGITRRFLVYPSYCVWPYSLSTIALNNALHESGSSSTPVQGPMRSTWRASMYKCFWVVFGIYFIYYFFPSYIFQSLTLFDWMAWIKPTNGKLVAMTSVNFGVGLGLNPWPTFDYGTLANSGGYYPMFVIYNFLGGLTIGFIIAIIFWFKNTWSCGHLPINSPSTFDNKGGTFKVTNIVDKMGRLVNEKYQQYSQPYMSATRLVSLIGTFAYTSCTLTHTLLYNRHELIIGIGGFWNDFKRTIRRIRGKSTAADYDGSEKESFGDDVHYRLMQSYPEVPEWWFLCVTLISMTFGFICLGVYTNVSPAVVMVAPIITIIFIIPVGIVTAVSGMEPSLNIISELIGGAFAGGDTMTVQYFRMFGSEPVYHALIYANDLKLSHYVKIPPRDMFWVQMWGALMGTLITVGQWQWLLDLPKVCTKEAPFRLICPAAQSNYSNFIFWGTIGAPKLFGKDGRYTWLLVGFPVGILLPVTLFLLKKKWKNSNFLQSAHPLLLTLSMGWTSGTTWGLYVPGVFINWFSWNFLKTKYLAFWNRYNYVTLAALSCAISINALIVFFALVFPGISFPDWWGNSGGTPGCIGEWSDECRLYKIPDVGYFGPAPGTFK